MIGEIGSVGQVEWLSEFRVCVNGITCVSTRVMALFRLRESPNSHKIIGFSNVFGGDLVAPQAQMRLRRQVMEAISLDYQRFGVCCSAAVWRRVVFFRPEWAGLCEV